MVQHMRRHRLAGIEVFRIAAHVVDHRTRSGQLIQRRVEHRLVRPRDLDIPDPGTQLGDRRWPLQRRRILLAVLPRRHVARSIGLLAFERACGAGFAPLQILQCLPASR
jgi:hypothetical protein